ncbi:MAG: iron complex transport system substrate-binding protein [Archaeoglobi archaeon]|nr:ABC transporter substrate-binding protein [Candidatus Mnemosynella bozhongmuii]MDI3502790.1 iron complex transport system substrate-binding protein [Archaeoglobi archaeon]MDK2782223.1 iron complex transport system substrate-binding protein [Archaeoglobi archaeon]
MREVLALLLMISLVASLSGCTTPVEEGTIKIKDAVGREVEIPSKVERIVSLSPDATRILVALGEEEKIVGVESYAKRCPVLNKVYPEIKNVSDVGNPWQGTLSLEKIAELQPDVVFVYGTLTEVADKIQNDLGIPTVCTYRTVRDLDDFLETVRLVGKVVKKEEKAEDIVNYISMWFEELENKTSSAQEKPKVLVVAPPFSKDPLRVMFGEHPFTLRYAGGINVASSIESSGYGPWATVSFEQVALWNPDVIFIHGMSLLTPEDLKNSAEWREIEAVKEGKVYKVFIGYVGYDPALLVVQTMHMAKALHPELFNWDFEEKANEVFEVIYGVDGVYTQLQEEFGLSKV